VHRRIPDSRDQRGLQAIRPRTWARYVVIYITEKQANMNLPGRLLRRGVRVTSVLLLLCLAAGLPAASAQQPTKLDPEVLKRTGVYHALVIGNNDYVRLQRLETAVKDATDVANILKSLYGFQVNLLLNATRDQIVRSISDYRRTLTDADHLLIYYAGHGHFDRPADLAYWQPVDADSENTANWISATDITSNMRAMPARHILVVADSCYSGAMRGSSASITPADKNRFLKQVRDKRSRTLLSSGGVEPVSDAGGTLNSVFAEALIQGLSAAEDQAFSAGSLFHEYIRVRVGGRAKQVPLYNAISNSGDEGGDFVFIKAAAPPKAAGDENNALWYHNRGTLYLDDGKYAEAETEYRKAAALEPGNAIYRVRLSETLYGQRKYTESEVEIREAIRLDPRDANHWNRLGNTVWALDQFAEAEQAYRKGLSIDPQHFWLNSNLARTLNRRGDFAGAEPLARRAAALSPGNADIYYTLGTALTGLNRVAEADAAFKRSLEIDPKKPGVWNDYGNGQFSSGNYAAAETSYRKAIELTPDWHVYRSNLSAALFNQRKYEEAEATARDVLKGNDSISDAPHYWLGRTLYATNRFADAERAFRRAVILGPANPDYHNWLANAMYSQKKYGEAELEYKEAIRLNPKTQYFLTNLATNYEDWQRPELAEQYYRRALAAAPSDPAYSRYLGVFLFRQNRFSEAKAVFDQILQREPNLELNQRNLANTLFKLNDLASAEAAIRRAVALKADSADAHFMLGQILEAQGKLADALRAFETAAKLAPQGGAPAEVTRLRTKIGSGRQ
jgi:tetratricopeptide (TPR) repeat protein